MIILFFLCILFVIYTYVGYPFILWVLTKDKAIEFPDHTYNKDITILMVVCNEEKNIENKINNLLSLKYKGNKKIIIVDDKSDDDTIKIINKFSDKVTLINSRTRLGKANGLNIGMDFVTTELVMLVDCRQRIEKKSLIYLSSWFDSSIDIGAVSGELMFEATSNNGISEGMDGYWKFEKFIRKSEAKINSVPGVTGAIYMLRTDLFTPLPLDTLLDDVLIPMQCSKQGFRVIFDERAVAWDKQSDSTKKEKLRKIRTLSGNYQLLLRNPTWIIPALHPIWWQFFSHKITRLLAPFFGITSLIIAFNQYMLSGSAFFLFYVLSAIIILMLLPLSLYYPAINKNRFIKLISSFLILNWFCVLAAIRFILFGSKGAWKR